MDITTLENWLWEAACSIRGPLDAPKYKDYILPVYRLLLSRHILDCRRQEREHWALRRCRILDMSPNL